MSLQQELISSWLGSFRFALADEAPHPGLRPLRLAIISEGTNVWPLYVAQAKKFFDREGVRVEVTLTGSSVRQLEDLRVGRYDIGFQQSDHVVRGVEEGADLFIFMALSHAPEMSLVVAPDIDSFSALRGKVIAVDGARTGYALLLRRLLADRGLRQADYHLQEVGGSQERFDALAEGRAAASLLNAPFDRRLVARGFRSLGTTSEYFPSYPGSIAAARRGWAREHRRQLVGFIRAFNAAYAWLQDGRNRDEAIAVLPERLSIDAATASDMLERIRSREQPVLQPDDLRQVIEIVWEAEGYDRPYADPARYVDLDYWREAVDGFSCESGKSGRNQPFPTET